MEPEPIAIGTVVGLLGACLVALVLVLTARREADQHRRRATEDVAQIRDDARAMLADAERRERRVADRERALADQRSELADLERRTRAEADALAEARRVGARELDKAERAAARTLADAERAANERLADAREQARAELESASGLTHDEALAELTRRIADQAVDAAGAQVRRAEAQARRTADARARRIVATAVQRVAVPTSAQPVVTILPLPSDEMKGRIIGKEGRNIRHFEALTGVNVLIDETPDSVVLSCFDPERREVAQVTLEALMLDGRIHPQRIEAAYAEALAGADDRHDAAGHEAAERAGIDRLHAELVRTMGRLRLRSSYGQNVLEHLVESAQIAASMAAELGADVDVARRGAFLHDVGKALTAEVPGTHALVGADLARRLGESESVVNAIAAHHDEVPPATVEAVLVQAADAISASRPGARRQEIDQYVERMGALEALVVAHQGVRRALAMAAGREVRVVVEPDEVDDRALPQLAATIAKHIEADLTYPGEIRVTVVRELRASATAG
ncbi:metal dependent phosphohydrolase [Cellulomonas flavigena DSM 20109]|uniref:Ribonuclease Y n=1 Tax=Cellulomonas flavigena (strain ATCC 482 / DSM 20109 / BCRC 11376 / JCM 18109 / NBRC 3775 / NCIMB 8073 / NRS 134) TaxID=446466 RepID=D5UDA8_CELFN|nr:ribonuclease Y [Cellulomonas flavigena]ADG74445.1 metal dependent phosphohydrolase [Cellulomonas flavigena DSM 20109]